MNFSRNFVLKLLIIVSTLYLSSLLIISEFFTQNKCHSTQSCDNLLNRMRITFILIEFEFFDNDLSETLESICGLSTISRGISRVLRNQYILRFVIQTSDAMSDSLTTVLILIKV